MGLCVCVWQEGSQGHRCRISFGHLGDIAGVRASGAQVVLENLHQTRRSELLP